MDKQNQVYIVSGEPRSGTSLMMKTLLYLGMDIEGAEFPQEKKQRIRDKAAAKNNLNIIQQEFLFEPDTSRQLTLSFEELDDIVKEEVINSYDRYTREEMAKMLNPKGFYETRFTMIGAQKVTKNMNGKVYKFITPGAYYHKKRNGKIIGTPDIFINKIVLCLRDPRHIALSQTKLIGMVKVAGILDMTEQERAQAVWDNAEGPPDPMRYVQGMGAFLAYLSDASQDVKDKILPIDFEDMHSNTSQTINRIIKHMDISPSNNAIEAAIDNVDPLLKRSTGFKGWSNDFQEAGQLAETIYNAMKNLGDDGQLQAAAAEYTGFANSRHLENIKWVDQKTWVTITPYLYRAMLRNINDIMANYLKSVDNKKRNNLVPEKCEQYGTGCKHFSISEEKYTLSLPDDLEPLERPMIACGRDEINKTFEQCKACWIKGSFIGEERVGPQKDYREG